MLLLVNTLADMSPACDLVDLSVAQVECWKVKRRDVEALQGEEVLDN